MAAVGMRKFRKILANPLVQLVFVMTLVYFLHSKLSSDAIRFFLTISVCLRELLVFVLPFLLFSFVAAALSSIPREGLFFVVGLMVIISLSNFINILASTGVGFQLLSGVVNQQIKECSTNLSPLFDPKLPGVMATNHALLLGVAVGVANSLRPQKYVSMAIDFLHDLVMRFMKKFFVPLLPAFVGGFLLKLFSEGRMTGFVEHNFRICSLMCLFLLCYLAVWLLVAASFRFEKALQILKNIFPAIVTSFSTMSSAAALPLSLNAAEKNTHDKVLADAVMPLTLNFHMVGDTIVVPIMAMMVLLAFNHPLPDVRHFVLFGIFFVLNKFAGGGVPSGTILVTVPVLRKFLGFDDEMTSFIIAFYGVMDPIATAGNVAANNLFVIIFQKIRATVKKRFPIRRSTSG